MSEHYPDPELAAHLLAAIVESSDDAIIGKDLHSIITSWNKGAEKIFGYSAGEMIGTSILRLIPPDRQDEEIQILSTIKRGERVEHFETLRLTKAGHLIDVSVTASPIKNQEGQIIGVSNISRDITEKKIAEVERQQLIQLIQRSQDFIAVADLEGKITFMNEGGRKMIGLDPDTDVSQIHFTDYVAPDWQDYFKNTVIPTALNQDIWEGEMQLVQMKTKELIHVFRTTFVLRDESGNKKYFATVTRDVTERKKFEESLLHSEASLAAAQCLAHMGSWDLNLGTGKGNWSLEMARLHYRNPELRAPSFEEFMEMVHPLDRPKLLKTHLTITQIPGPIVVEYRTHPDLGPVRHLSATVQCLPDTLRQTFFLVGTTLDITERKRAEERFRRLVDSNVQGVMFWTLDGRITGANDAYLQIVDYTREELDAGRILSTGMTPSEYPSINTRAFEELARKGVCTPFEMEYTRRDGTRIPVLIGAASFEDNPNEGVCFVLDLTERKKLELQFLRAQRMESIGTLAGGIAHDLNNILAPIMMSIDVLKTTVTSDYAKGILSTIEVSAKRGADIVRQVLSFGRGLYGERIEVKPKHLLQDLENIIKDTFPKSVRLNFIVSDDVWMILGDPTQIHQVLLNLSVNARDAMPQGGTLNISVENCILDEQYAAMNFHDRAGRYVKIIVTDTGMGIPPELVGKIFEPFFTTKELHQGTGLGLSTVLAIVKSHEGIINVYTEVGKGTTFKIYLPAVELSPDARKEQTEQATLPRGDGETILVVDDEASILSITGQTLQAFGYKVITASDGAEAVALYAQHRHEISVILTDMMMPIMDGPAMIHALMRINPEVKILAASGLNANGRLAKVAGAGVKHFLTKPYTASTLLKTVKAILDEP